MRMAQKLNALFMNASAQSVLECALGRLLTRSAVGGGRLDAGFCVRYVRFCVDERFGACNRWVGVCISVFRERAHADLLTELLNYLCTRQKALR